jgi:hypothetical protein
VAGSCERGNEYPISMKGVELCNQVNDDQLLKNDCVPRS